MSAECAAQSCNAPIADTDLMCTSHWTLVPASLRDAITRPGGPPDRDSAYAVAAIAEVAHKERKTKPPAARAARKQRKPEQLALF